MKLKFEVQAYKNNVISVYNFIYEYADGYNNEFYRLANAFILDTKINYSTYLPTELYSNEYSLKGIKNFITRFLESDAKVQINGTKVDLETLDLVLEGKNLEYRPFETFKELPFKLGDKIRLKTAHNERDALLTSIHLDFQAETIVALSLDGMLISTPQELFNKYEYLDKDGEWRPFGVKI